MLAVPDPSGAAGILPVPLGRKGAASAHSQTPSKQGRGSSRVLGEDHGHVVPCWYDSVERGPQPNQWDPHIPAFVGTRVLVCPATALPCVVQGATNCYMTFHSSSTSTGRKCLTHSGEGYEVLGVVG
jgi:hypothetical protein